VPTSALEGSPDAVIRRSPSGTADASATSGSAPSTATATAAGSTATHGVSAAAGSLIGRLPAALFDRARAELRASLPPAAFDASASGQVIRREFDGAGAAPAVAGSTVADHDAGGPSVQESLTSREWQQLVDEVVRRIEDRVTAELARRGRRSTPRSF